MILTKQMFAFPLIEPVVGGCNTELPLENDPNIYIENKDDQNIIHYAYANEPLDKASSQRNCEDADVGCFLMALAVQATINHYVNQHPL